MFTKLSQLRIILTTSLNSGGIRSCTRDLRKLYQAFAASLNDQALTSKSQTPGNPFKRSKTLAFPSTEFNSYPLSHNFGGWISKKLPNFVSSAYHPPLLRPVIGGGLSPQPILYHSGSLPGALARAMILSDSETVICVL